MAQTIAEIVEDRIWIRTPYDKRVIEQIKAIQGTRWNPHKEVWTAPVDWSIFGELCAIPQVLSGLEMGLNLTEWAQKESERQAQIPDVLSLDGVNLPVLEATNAKLHAAMASRPFQTVTPGFVAMQRAVLLADDPGLGKTLQTIASIQEAGVTGPILVIAPKAAVDLVWPVEILRWSAGDKFGTMGPHIPASQRGATLDKVRAACVADPSLRFWVLTTSHYVRAAAVLDEYGKFVYEDDKRKVKMTNATLPEMFNMEWAGIVVDESHRFVAAATGNRKKQSAQMQGLGALQLRQGGVKIALSGTPFRGKPENLYGTLNWLRPDLYTSYWKWAKKYFEMWQDGYSGANVLGELKSPRKFYEDAKAVMIRREKGEVAKDLPPKQYGGSPWDPSDENSVIGVWLTMSGEQKRQYNALVKDAAAMVEGGTIMPNGILAEMTRLKQIASASHCMKDGVPHPQAGNLASSNKLDWILEFLEERGIDGKGETGRKVIIASQFTKYINFLHEELATRKIPNVRLTGETPAKMREASVKAFQDPENICRVFLLNTIAGGVALTLDQADDVVICDETFNPDDQLQVEDRAHRLSRTDHQVTIWYLRTRDTIEEAIGTTTAEREATCRNIADGMRGVSIKKLLRKE